jgi:hypothetical protein
MELERVCCGVELAAGKSKLPWVKGKGIRRRRGGSHILRGGYGCGQKQSEGGIKG